MATSDWIKVGVDLLQAIISGLVVAVGIFWLDGRRAIRERRLSDFRIASNWGNKAKVSLRELDLTRANLSGHDFTGADLERTVFENATIWGTDFTEANLRDTNFQKSNIAGVKFMNAKLHRVDFSKSIISWRHPKLKYRPDLSGAELRKAQFRRAKLHGVNFRNADLEHVDFTGADIQNCDFTNANLSYATWKRAKIVNCLWENIIFDDIDHLPKSIRKMMLTQDDQDLK